MLGLLMYIMGSEMRCVKKKSKTWVERESAKRREYHLRTRHSVVYHRASSSEARWISEPGIVWLISKPDKVGRWISEQGLVR